jgi:hypothetical protein
MADAAATDVVADEAAAFSPVAVLQLWHLFQDMPNPVFFK